MGMGVAVQVSVWSRRNNLVIGTDLTLINPAIFYRENEEGGAPSKVSRDLGAVINGYGYFHPWILSFAGFCQAVVRRGGQANVENGCAFFHIQAHDLKQALLSIDGYNSGSEEFDGIWAFHGGRCEDARDAIPSLPCVWRDTARRGSVGDDPQLDPFV